MRTHLLLTTAAAALLATTSSTRAQTSWTGAVSTDWFNAGNWTAGLPDSTTTAIISTVTPNATVVGIAGATAESISIGVSGTGMLTIQSGGTVSSGSASMVTVGGTLGQGALTVTGAGSTWTNSGTLTIGGSSGGTGVIANGGTVKSGGGTVGAGTQGTATVTGAGSTWTNNSLLTVGSFGTGMLTITDGGAVSSGGGFVGLATRGTVTVTGAGSTWTNSAGLTVGDSGTGTLTVGNGGTVVAPTIVLGRNFGSIGTLNIGAGSGAPPEARGTVMADFVTNPFFGGGTGTINFNHTSADYVFAPEISNSVSVNVFAGTTILTAENSYVGDTTIFGGTLAAGGNFAFSSNSHTFVKSGGTLDLRGFDQHLFSLENGGTVQTGGSPGPTAPGTTLTVGGDLIFATATMAVMSATTAR